MKGRLFDYERPTDRGRLYSRGAVGPALAAAGRHTPVVLDEVWTGQVRSIVGFVEAANPETGCVQLEIFAERAVRELARLADAGRWALLCPFGVGNGRPGWNAETGKQIELVERDYHLEAVQIAVRPSGSLCRVERVDYQTERTWRVASGVWLDATAIEGNGFVLFNRKEATPGLAVRTGADGRIVRSVGEPVARFQALMRTPHGSLMGHQLEPGTQVAEVQTGEVDVWLTEEAAHRLQLGPFAP